MEFKNEFDMGICCFCGFECNPLSQSCGSCARGISGIALGIPVPPHMREFIYNCQKDNINDIKTDSNHCSKEFIIKHKE